MENGCSSPPTRWSAIGTILTAAIIFARRHRYPAHRTSPIQCIALHLGARHDAFVLRRPRRLSRTDSPSAPPAIFPHAQEPQCRALCSIYSFAWQPQLRQQQLRPPHSSVARRRRHETPVARVLMEPRGRGRRLRLAVLMWTAGGGRWPPPSFLRDYDEAALKVAASYARRPLPRSCWP